MKNFKQIKWGPRADPKKRWDLIHLKWLKRGPDEISKI